MKKIAALIILQCVFSSYCFSQSVKNIDFTVEISNIIINGGKIWLVIYSNADEYKNDKPHAYYKIEDNATIISYSLSLPYGEYVITVCQDTNGNDKLDYGLLGIPKEPIGISNYFGKGYPSRSFDKQKVLIDDKTVKINIGLYKL